MGDGMIVTPTDNVLYAPADGTVEFVFDTKHAIGFVTDTGVSMLMHIGIDTVKLNGEGFTAHVSSGQSVKKGDRLITFDIKYLKEHAPSVETPVVCTELGDNEKISIIATGDVSVGEPLYRIDKI